MTPNMKTAMTRLSVNGREIEAAVASRTQLAEFLRENALLTGTHLGCEHGICGACTVLVDGAPVRSCITYAVACAGAEVTTIEGLDGDALAAELRAAFREHHALQCGFCTPGMMMTARDIVTRLPQADEQRIRLELGGNLCRCTGYVGVVKAIQQVIARRAGQASTGPAGSETPPPVGRLGPAGARPAAAAANTDINTGIPMPPITPAVPAPAAPLSAPVSASGKAPAGGAARPRPINTLHQTLRIGVPLTSVWAQFADVVALSRCMPGADMSLADDGVGLRGSMRVKFGPISATFEARANNVRHEDAHHGTLTGEGYDRRTGTRVVSEIDYALTATDDEQATVVEIEVRYGLAGTLAQFARGALVENYANRLAMQFADNLERLLNGEAPIAAGPMPRRGLRAVLAGWLRKLLASDARKENQ